MSVLTDILFSFKAFRSPRLRMERTRIQIAYLVVLAVLVVRVHQGLRLPVFAPIGPTFNDYAGVQRIDATPSISMTMP